MKEYLKRISSFSKHLKSCAAWHASNTSISNLKTASENDKDYVYEFFVYLAILKDLSNNYDLVYYAGNKKKKDLFPKNPANKEGVPFFYITHKIKKSEQYQVCAGTKIQSKISRKRAPDISFQKYSADLINPQLTDVLMIFDTKRKRTHSKSQKLSDGQYSFFFTMIYQFNLRNADKTNIEFYNFKRFVGNCLITNKEAFSGNILDNNAHFIKEVEYFDDTINIGNIRVIG